METSRAEHLAWCKQRALSELDGGGDEEAINRALNSFVSDLGKHPETQEHIVIRLILVMRVGGNLSTPQQVTEFINGTN